MELRDSLAEHAGASPRDFILVAPYGLGDTYLICAFASAFKAQHCRDGQKLFVVTKESHAALAQRFRGIDRYHFVPDAGLSRAARMRDGEQNTLAPGCAYWAHPNFAKVRPDHCVAVGRMTDAAMYALLLGLDPRTPLSLPDEAPRFPPNEGTLLVEKYGIVPGRTVLLFPHAASWPAVPNKFWAQLIVALSEAGWYVVHNDPRDMPLRIVPALAELCGWAIGANSGIMQMLVSGRARCRKTILTQSLAGASYPLPVSSAHPYRLMRSVDGQQYDIEEFEVSADGWISLINAVAQGRNAQGPLPSPDPVTFLELPSSPGDLLDRYTILLIKAHHLPEKKHLLHREIAALKQHWDRITQAYPSVLPLEADLHVVNRDAWEANDVLFQHVHSGYGTPKWSIELNAADLIKAETVIRAFAAAHAANQARVRLKNEIDALCGAGTKELKQYDT